MKLPEMKYADRIGKTQQVRFGGLDRRLGAGDGSIFHMENLTSDHAPVLATREKRSGVAKLEVPWALAAWEELVWVDGSAFCYGGVEKGKVTEGEKIFASIGSKIIILPDKCYYDAQTDTFGSLEASWTGTATFEDGLLYEEAAEANTIRAESAEWEKVFRAGDAVTISGCVEVSRNNKTAIIRAIDGDKLYFYENTFTLGQEGAVTVERTVPDLLFLCENENRLWGCTRDTIYASKLGDPFNWNVYDGLNSDAWALAPGSAGDFTGCVSYKGYAVFFKEDHIYKVYGATPSNFTAAGSASLGLKQGAHKSLAVAGEVLYYVGTNGVMAYAGGIPQLISRELGDIRFSRPVAGSDGLKYYLSETADGKDALYVYDTQRNLWHREDDTGALDFGKLGGVLHFLNKAGEVWAMAPPAEDAFFTEADLSWSVEFGDFTENDPNKKGLTRLQLRLELEKKAWMEAQIQFDSDGTWRPLGRILGEDPKRSHILPIIPRRCDHYRLRLAGKGACRIYSLAREYYSGSDFRSKNGRY